MKHADELQNGPVSARARHLCLDMQNLFSTGAPWETPWLPRVLPAIQAIAERHADRTIFTKFVPPIRADDAPGMWKPYYEHWRQVTREHLDPVLLELLPPLARLVPPARVLMKDRYSPFHGTGFAQQLCAEGIDTLIFTGAETDVCVLSAVMDAVDLGLRCIVVTDAICSASDETHDALMTLYRRRLQHQIEMANAETVLREWSAL